jgi:hypothetical protein
MQGAWYDVPPLPVPAWPDVPPYPTSLTSGELEFRLPVVVLLGL